LVAWLALLVFTLTWSQLPDDEVRRMVFIALLPLGGGLVLKRALRYIIRGN
jgi:hypothetical protein